MRRYTTATPTLVVEGINISSNTVWITFKQIFPDDIDSTVFNTLSKTSFDSVILTVSPTSNVKSGNDTVVTCSLTQEQTAQFKPGRIRVQVNWKTSGGIRKATDIVYIPSFENLLEEVK